MLTGAPQVSSGEKLLNQCEKCRSKFVVLGNLKKHLWWVHEARSRGFEGRFGNLLADLSIRFIWLWNILIHWRKQSVLLLLNFKCEECRYRFKTKEVLNIQMICVHEPFRFHVGAMYLFGRQMLTVKDDPSNISEHDDVDWTVDPNNNSQRVTRIVASLLGALSALRALRASGYPAGLY